MFLFFKFSFNVLQSTPGPILLVLHVSESFQEPDYR